VSGKHVYLDFAATTPVDPRVAETMQSCLSLTGAYANPASIHIAGRESYAQVENARHQLAELLGADPRCLIWTSGATESDNLAIVGAAHYRAHRGKHLVTMPTEHKAVTDTFKHLEKNGYEVSWLEPDADGILAMDLLESNIREDTQLVSIMHVNNETGVIQDIRRIGEICRGLDVLFHTDASQGPQGIGALYIADRPGCRVLPIMHGGGQERRLRPGSLPVHQIVGLGTAARIARDEMDQDLRHARHLRDRLWQGIQDLPGLVRNGDAEHTFPGILNVSAEGVEGESLMLGLEPVCAASGSACNSLSGESSYVLDFAIERYRWTVERLRSIAPLVRLAS
jgi:cysteine desulfurase